MRQNISPLAHSFMKSRLLSSMRPRTQPGTSILRAAAMRRGSFAAAAGPSTPSGMADASTAPAPSTTTELLTAVLPEPRRPWLIGASGRHTVEAAEDDPMEPMVAVGRSRLHRAPRSLPISGRCKTSAALCGDERPPSGIVDMEDLSPPATRWGLVIDRRARSLRGPATEPHLCGLAKGPTTCPAAPPGTMATSQLCWTRAATSALTTTSAALLCSSMAASCAKQPRAPWSPEAERGLQTDDGGGQVGRVEH